MPIIIIIIFLALGGWIFDSQGANHNFQRLSNQKLTQSQLDASAAAQDAQPLNVPVVNNYGPAPAAKTTKAKAASTSVTKLSWNTIITSGGQPLN